MIIASLKKKGQNVEIVFENGTKILFDYRAILDHGLRKNDELDDDKINLLLSHSEQLHTKDSAFRFLSTRLHSSKELKDKLAKKGYTKSIINDVIEQLQQKQLLNDHEFAKAFVIEKFEKKKSGAVKIKSELMKKGIDRQVIEIVISGLDQTQSESNAYELISKKLKQIQRKETDKRKIKQKLYSYLSSKGYKYDIIINSINKLNLDSDVFE